MVIRGGYGLYYSPGQNDDVMAPIDSMAVRGELTSAAAYPVQDDIPLALGRANSRPRTQQRDRNDMYATIDPLTGVRLAAPFLTTQIDQKSWFGRTEYDGLLGLHRGFRAGLLLQANYTRGRSRDNNAGNGEGSEWQNARCGECEWGPSDYDARHSIAINTVYQLPFGAGRARMTEGFASAILGGWDISAVLIAKSGRPINVTIERAGPDGDDVNQRPNVVPGVNATTGNTARWLNPAAFVAPAPSEFGNSPRNGLRGPGSWQLDFAFNKNGRLAGRWAVELRLDAFNVFDVDQFGNPARVSSQPLTFGLLSPLNSGPTGTGTARQIQLGVRLTL